MSSHKDVAVHSVSNIKDDGFYFRGYCLEKAKILTFRHDRVIEYFENKELATDYLNNLPEQVYKQFDEKINSQRKVKRTNNLDNITFCFSGFKKARKEELIKLAEEKDLRTVMGMSRSVDFLVIDESSHTVGVKKLNQATEYGIQIINENDFLLMLETGEIPA